MTNNNTTTNTTNTNNIDEAWEAYVKSLPGFVFPENGSIEASYERAERLRSSYRAWLFRIFGGDPSPLIIKEIERTQSSGDEGINRWFTRETLGDLEYGISEEETLSVQEGDTGYLHLLEEADKGPNLLKVKDYTFETKGEATSFMERIRKTFRSGNHSKEILSWTISPEGSINVNVLEADENWEHRKLLSETRDLHLKNALTKVEKSTTVEQLKKIAKIAREYSRDMQVLNMGKTFDAKRKVGIGFTYVRFATVMNAIADRAETLHLGTWRRYPINEFPQAKPIDGDIMDHGCRQGEFLAFEIPDETVSEESLWKQREGLWKPSKACQKRLDKAGPTSFIWREHWQIADDVNRWLGSVSVAA